MTAYPINATTIKMRFHAFRDVPDARIEFAIEEAFPDVSKYEFGDRYITALSYRTAHILEVAIQRMASGTGQLMASLNVGGEISVTYANPTLPDGKEFSDLHTTPYGVRYLELCALAVPAVAII